MNAMAKLFSVLCVAAMVGCVPERIASVVRPMPIASSQAKSDSVDVAMCEHWPSSSIRLYGCDATGYSNRSQALIIVDGKQLPTDSVGRGKTKRERALAALDPSRVKLIEVFGRNDPGMLSKYGHAGRNGVIVITMLDSRAKQPSSQQPNTR
jgi:hypothetical protein